MMINILLIVSIITVIIIGSKNFKADEFEATELQVIEPKEKEEAIYKDVSKEHEKYDLVMWATEKELIEPDESGNFNPDEAMKEQDLAKIMVNYFPTIKEKLNITNEMSKEEKIDAYYHLLQEENISLDGIENENVRGEAVIKGIVAKTIMDLVSEEEIRYQSHAIELLTTNEIWPEVENFIEATDESITKLEVVETFKKMEEKGLVDVVNKTEE